MKNTLIILLLFTTIYCAQELKVFNQANSKLLSNKVNSIFITPNNNKWIGTNKGISLLREDLSWDSITTSNGLSSNIIIKIKSDISKLDTSFLEIATQGGVNRLNITNTDIVVLDNRTKENSGLLSDTISCLAINANGTHWYGSLAGCSTFDGSTWNIFTEENNKVSSNEITDIVSPKNDWTYIATNGWGISRLKQNVDGISKASEITNEWSGLASDSVNTVFIDRLGHRWYGSTEGVSMHFGEKTKKNWSNYTLENGLISNDVTAICEDSVGTMWFGTKVGLSSYDETNWKSYTVDNGLSGNKISDIAVDKNGDLWIATNNGVTYFKKKVISVENIKQEKNNLEISLSTFPNPFNLQVRINFFISVAGNVALNIYDLNGREVFKFEEEFSKGNHFTFWNGIDIQNKIVSSGIYICQLVTNGQMVSKKLLLLK